MIQIFHSEKKTLAIEQIDENSGKIENIIIRKIDM